MLARISSCERVLLRDVVLLEASVVGKEVESNVTGGTLALLMYAKVL